MSAWRGMGGPSIALAGVLHLFGTLDWPVCPHYFGRRMEDRSAIIAAPERADIRT